MVDPLANESICSEGIQEELKSNSTTDQQEIKPCSENDSSSETKPNASKYVWSLRKKLMLFTMCVTYFTALASVSIISPFFPNEAYTKGASKTVVGMVFSTYPLVGVILSPVYGIMAPRIGVHFTLISCFFVFGGVSLLFGFLSMMPDGAVFIAFCFLLRIVEAVAGTGMEAAYYIIVAVEFPEKIATVMGLTDTFMGIGLMAGPALGGFLYELGGFKLPFLVLGGAQWLILPLVWILLPKDKERTSEEGNISVLQILKIPTISIIAFICIGDGIALSFLEPSLAPYLKKVCKLSPSMVGLLFLLYSGAYTISSPLLGWIGDKTKRYFLIMTVGVLSSAAGFLLIGPSPFLESAGIHKGKVWLVCVAIIIIGVSNAAAFVPVIPCMLQAATSAGFPGDEAAVSGIVSGVALSTLNIGALIGPTMSGVLDQHIGFEWATTILCFIVAAQGFLLVVLNFCSKSLLRPSVTVPTSINDTEDEREPLLGNAGRTVSGLV